MRVCIRCGKSFKLDRNDFEDCRTCLACRKREISDREILQYLGEYPFCPRCGRKRNLSNSHHHFDCDECWEREARKE
jgi:hypothetical protein